LYPSGTEIKRAALTRCEVGTRSKQDGALWTEEVNENQLFECMHSQLYGNSIWNIFSLNRKASCFTFCQRNATFRAWIEKSQQFCLRIANLTLKQPLDFLLD
jgi:hypothetical protein